MADSDQIEAAIVASATGPRRVQVDNTSVEQHPLTDQIAARNAAAAAGAASSPAFGLRFTRMIPPGCG